MEKQEKSKAKQSKNIIIEGEDELLPPAPRPVGKPLADVLAGFISGGYRLLLCKIGFIPPGFGMKVFVGCSFPCVFS